MLIKNCQCYNPLKGKFEKADLQIDSNGLIQRKERSIISPNKDEVIFDLKDKYLYPAFIDSHIHLVGTGQKILHPSLENITSLEKLGEILNSINEPLIMLRGWDEERFSLIPERKIIDSCLKNKPVILIRKCGHIATVNTALINKFQIKEFANENELDFERGIISGETLEKLKKKIKMDRTTFKLYLEAGSKEFLKYGVTSVHSDDWYSVELSTLIGILKQNKLIRIYEKIYTENLDSLLSLINNNDKLFQKEGDFLSIKAIKIYLDGSLGGRTAYLKSPYFDNRSTKGNIYFTEEELSKIIRVAENNSIQITAHVIGDGALEIALKAFEKNIENENPLRHRLIHLQVASKEQLKRIKNLNLYVSIQPIFYESDYKMAINRLGKSRFKNKGYPFKELLELGINFSLSTDSPIESPNPFENLAVAERFMPRKEAFLRYTLSGAKASFQEKKIGALQVGQFADAFVLSKDLFKLSENKLKEILPEKILIGGKWL